MGVLSKHHVRLGSAVNHVLLRCPKMSSKHHSHPGNCLRLFSLVWTLPSTIPVRQECAICSWTIGPEHQPVPGQSLSDRVASHCRDSRCRVADPFDLSDFSNLSKLRTYWNLETNTSDL